MKNKKIVALVLAGLLTIGLTAFAMADDNSAEGSLVGEGGVEAILDMNVAKVELPAITSEGITFTMDPQGLMDSAYHGGKGAVYFLNNASDVTKSSDIVVKNKSSFKADAVLTIEIETPGITLVSKESDLVGAKTPSLYLAITDGTNTKAITGYTQFASVLDKIEYKVYGSPTALPGYTQGASGNYYVYLPVDSTASNDVTFNIFGKCDSSANWSSIKNVESTIKITWGFVEHDDNPNPSIEKTAYDAVPDTPIEINADMGSGEGIATGIGTITYVESGRVKELEVQYYTYADGSIVISPDFVNMVIASGKPKSITLVFNNEDRTSIEIVIKP